MNELRRDEPLTTSLTGDRNDERRWPDTDVTGVQGNEGTQDPFVARESGAAPLRTAGNPPVSEYDPSISARDDDAFRQNKLAPSSTLTETSAALLFPEGELHHFRARWDQVQASFVDEPRHAVEEADTLVATVVKRITEQFAEERTKLESQWDRSGTVSTEDLRQGLRRYRALFDRLLAFQPDSTRSLDAERVA